jgi:hypothetical protein
MSLHLSNEGIKAVNDLDHNAEESAKPRQRILADLHGACLARALSVSAARRDALREQRQALDKLTVGVEFSPRDRVRRTKTRPRELAKVT